MRATTTRATRTSNLTASGRSPVGRALAHYSSVRVFLIAVVGAALAVAGQAETPHLTEWGDPDLRGIWSSATITPLERPLTTPDKTHLSEAEAENDQQQSDYWRLHQYEDQRYDNGDEH